MKEMMFFDANCKIGNGVDGPHPGVGELLAEMDRYGVDRALVQHNSAGTIGAVSTNSVLLEMLEKDDPEHRLECVWNILPVQCHELPEPDTFFSVMKERGVHAITFNHIDFRFVPCRLTLGGYLDEAVRRRIPVLLDCFSGKWSELYAFLQEFPKLTCIIHAGDKWGRDRYIRPLLENYPGVHVEISGYWVPEGIADLAKLYGAERLLYASRFPKYNQGAGMLQVKHSGLDRKDVALIAGQNLANLLEGTR